jgi:Mitochondrial ribosomal protein L31
VVDTISAALQRNGAPNAKAIDRWYSEMPREEEMLAKDKYTIFDRKEKRYRKGIHSQCQAGWNHSIQGSMC